MVNRTVEISAPAGSSVTGIISNPERCRANVTPGLVLAHGKANNLDQPLLVYVAHYLSEAGAASTLRFNFPYAEGGSSVPDPPLALEATFRRAHDTFADDPICPPGSMFLGGKSLGARIAAELVSKGPEADGLLADGLVFLGFPLHAAGRKDRPGLEPLRRLNVPSLFVAGTHDPFCDPDLLTRTVAGLDAPGTIYMVEGADHSFKVSSAGKAEQEEVFRGIAEQVAQFIRSRSAGGAAAEGAA